MAGFNIHHPLAARFLERRHIQTSSCCFETDNKRMHSLASWVSEKPFSSVCTLSKAIMNSASADHSGVLTDPQMETSHPALVVLVGVFPVLLAD